MRSVSEGDRGAAVEDIQRRLLALDHDLGPTGVDGVFLGMTLAAVREFQDSIGVPGDGVVGPETWAALVDATFTLGDRLLYLRFPYLHGRDVTTVQRILNTIGFSCGTVDGIFGAFCEQAVREFQHNTGAPADGIVGAETVTALMHLRHIWEGREGDAPASVRLTTARASEVLTRKRLALLWEGEEARDLAGRVENLALASAPGANITIAPATEDTVDADIVLSIALGHDPADVGVPVVTVATDTTTSLAARVVTGLRALAAEGSGPPLVRIDLEPGTGTDERDVQAVAVGLLDGLCAGLS